MWLLFFGWLRTRKIKIDIASISRVENQSIYITELHVTILPCVQRESLLRCLFCGSKSECLWTITVTVWSQSDSIFFLVVSTILKEYFKKFIGRNHFAENSQIFQILFIKNYESMQTKYLLSSNIIKMDYMYCIVTIKIELYHDSVSLTSACIVGLLSL